MQECGIWFNQLNVVLEKQYYFMSLKGYFGRVLLDLLGEYFGRHDEGEDQDQEGRQRDGEASDFLEEKARAFQKGGGAFGSL
ncbi:hypothetical protein F3Y22_tig00002840pilonHSYRG00939 [Hibiscus syriacus]|uniref:Uncharacterized protein n=1 Tax=Hibiscus syriacus TaxID=106335 RepID=A0A6A3CP83_HIBSY|nr:hypothetical protein F3Y22_tig00002840pilonHSYRG00939 [Hibiscus syriacus]